MTCFKYLLLAICAAFAQIAIAQDYPVRPIRIMIGFPPVGAADLTARTLGQKLTDVWGKAIKASGAKAE